MSSLASLPLKRFSTCEISDALIKIGLPHGGHIPDIRMISPQSGSTRICGPAYTVQMVMKSDTTSPSLTAHFVDTAPEGSVIVIDAPPHAKNAVWGGLMTAGAKARGALGVIISGRCRDIAEHREAGFPVFSRGQSTLGQSPFTRPSAVNIPLIISPQGVSGNDPEAFPAVRIEPGDWLIADEDGVVCVPTGLAAKVAELADKGRQIDVKCMEDLVAGEGIQETFKKHRGK
ncbi:4-hydroxy-4-methyl-2-oxoglutarate aldolase [Sparassis crispa]|uniref:4-hydroxy-4-methyl-2-oxoglutarate aldolase n=1 Tax=Sparassis crispa TaxID=139825 RepID=A0A401GG19_9APHY|nr:4-hydroxy-4-methyl-2-oxoglutarate aldolase [Sparassis crispa]GBE81137.1 4-hydroxy-4-methyl-2-oxoglutarate aldolase [Sparassis crispa]